jgi:hypothetical protein
MRVVVVRGESMTISGGQQLNGDWHDVMFGKTLRSKHDVSVAIGMPSLQSTAQVCYNNGSYYRENRKENLQSMVDV